MKGTNTIILNLETVTEAIQEFFNRTFAAPVTVTKVDHSERVGGDFLSVDFEPAPAALPEVNGPDWDLLADALSGAISSPRLFDTGDSRVARWQAEGGSVAPATPRTGDTEDMVARIGAASAAPARVPLADRLMIAALTPIAAFGLAGLVEWRLGW